MKGIMLVLDGISDEPNKELGGKTPLEAAKTPNLDGLAKKSLLGRHKPVNNNNAIPESDRSVISLLGNKEQIYARGRFEALGAGIKLQRGDLALRANYATINNLKEGKIIDRRVGRILTTKEGIILARTINKRVKLPIKWLFKTTIQHRGVLVLMGGFSDMITDTDPEYQRNKKIKNKGQHKLSRALDEEENTEYTADMVNRFITQSNKILTTHPINRRRVERGLLPANIILTRGASVETPKLKQLPTWGAVAYMPVEKGIAQVAGMKTYSFSYPTLKKQNEEGVYENLYSGLIKACRYSLRMIKKKIKKHKYLYVHLKETDTPGHDGKAIEKKKMIEIIDKELIGKIKGIIEKEKIKMIITGDHTTSSTQKEHTPQPVPLMLLDWKHKGEGKRLTEINAKKGKLKSIKTYEVMKKCGFDE